MQQGHDTRSSYLQGEAQARKRLCLRFALYLCISRRLYALTDMSSISTESAQLPISFKVRATNTASFGCMPLKMTSANKGAAVGSACARACMRAADRARERSRSERARGGCQLHARTGWRAIRATMHSRTHLHVLV